MQEEETRKNQTADYQVGQDLSLMSVDEIEETINTLKDEIDRLQGAKNHKQGHLSQAQALFTQKS